jgi:hypothetical protein
MEPRGLILCSVEDGDVKVGVLPEPEEILMFALAEESRATQKHERMMRQPAEKSDACFSPQATIGRSSHNFPQASGTESAAPRFRCTTRSD